MVTVRLPGPDNPSSVQITLVAVAPDTIRQVKSVESKTAAWTFPKEKEITPIDKRPFAKMGWKNVGGIVGRIGSKIRIVKQILRHPCGTDHDLDHQLLDRSRLIELLPGHLDRKSVV